MNEILLSSKLSSDEAEELEEIMELLKEEIIDVQHSNGDDIDPEIGEEYDFSDLIIDLEIVVPEDWEE